MSNEICDCDEEELMENLISCERCFLEFPEDQITDVDGKEGWGELCEDCCDSLSIVYDELEDDE